MSLKSTKSWVLFVTRACHGCGTHSNSEQARDCEKGVPVITVFVHMRDFDLFSLIRPFSYATPGT
jgi:hypothetical protein